MALENKPGWREENVTFPLKRERMDVYAIRHPFDYVTGKIKDGPTSSFSEDKFVRESIVELRYNQHAWEHRCSCFKKNDECRAFLPTLLQGEDDIDWDRNNGVDCFSWDLEGNEIIPIERKICAFTVFPQRDFGDQYLNVHSKIMSNIFACNTNVQIGDIGHLFYNTIYTSKTTQGEDSRNFLFISNAYAMAFQRQIEKQQKESNGSSASTSSSDEAPDFVEGLIRVMAGIRAHMASTIISAPMAHLLCTRNSRFQLSHETKGLPIAQLEDLEEGNEISYYYRRGKKSGGGNEKSDDNDDSDDREQEVDNNDNNDEEIIVWPDCFADIYMMRPETETVEKMSAFEFVMKCEVVYKNPQPNENSESDDTRSSKRYKGGILDFTDQHPSKGRAHVRELKHERIPIIYSKYEYTNISLLELNSNSPSEAAINHRESYAKLALLLFYPFRDFSELKCYQNGESQGEENCFIIVACILIFKLIIFKWTYEIYIYINLLLFQLF